MLTVYLPVMDDIRFHFSSTTVCHPALTSRSNNYDQRRLCAKRRYKRRMYSSQHYCITSTVAKIHLKKDITKTGANPSVASAWILTLHSRGSQL